MQFSTVNQQEMFSSSASSFFKQATNFVHEKTMLEVDRSLEILLGNFKTQLKQFIDEALRQQDNYQKIYGQKQQSEQIPVVQGPIIKKIPEPVKPSYQQSLNSSKWDGFIKQDENQKFSKTCQNFSQQIKVIKPEEPKKPDPPPKTTPTEKNIFYDTKLTESKRPDTQKPPLTPAKLQPIAEPKKPEPPTTSIQRSHSQPGSTTPINKSIEVKRIEVQMKLPMKIEQPQQPQKSDIIEPPKLLTKIEEPKKIPERQTPKPEQGAQKPVEPKKQQQLEVKKIVAEEPQIQKIYEDSQQALKQDKIDNSINKQLKSPQITKPHKNEQLIPLQIPKTQQPIVKEVKIKKIEDTKPKEEESPQIYDDIPTILKQDQISKNEQIGVKQFQGSSKNQKFSEEQKITQKQKDDSKISLPKNDQNDIYKPKIFNIKQLLSQSKELDIELQLDSTLQIMLPDNNEHVEQMQSLPSPPKLEFHVEPPGKKQDSEYSEVFDDEDLDELGLGSGKRSSKKMEQAKINVEEEIAQFEEEDEDFIESQDKKQVDEEAKKIAFLDSLGNEEESKDLEEGDEINFNQIIDPQNLQQINAFCKSTGFVGMDPKSFVEYNHPDFIIQLFEEFTQQTQVFILQYDAAESIQIAMSGQSVEEVIQGIQDLISSELQQLGLDTLPMGIRIFLPLYGNIASVVMVEACPDKKTLTFFHEEEVDQADLESEEFQMLAEILASSLFCPEDCEIQNVFLTEQSVLAYLPYVADAQDSQIKYMILLFTLLYEGRDPHQIEITQGTFERLFMCLSTASPLYELLESQQQEFVMHFQETLQLIQQSKPNILVNMLDYDISKKLDLNAVQKELMEISTKFSNDQKLNQGFIHISFSDKFIYYVYLSKKPKNQNFIELYMFENQNEFNETFLQLFYQVFDQPQAKYQRKFFLDYHRHNGLSEYGQCSFPLWIEMVVFQEMKSSDAFSLLCFSMAPLYISCASGAEEGAEEEDLEVEEFE